MGWYKVILVMVFAGVLATWAIAGFYLFQDSGTSRRVAIALKYRIYLSVVLILLVLFGLSSGLLIPNSL